MGALKILAAGTLLALAGALTATVHAATPPLVVRALLGSNAVRFGDVVETRVVVILDPARVRPETLHVVADLEPLTALEPARVSRTVKGTLLVVAFSRRARCISAACTASDGEATPALPRPAASIQTTGGSVLTSRAAWPRLDVRGRVRAADLRGAQPPFRGRTAPSAPSYRLSPSTLAALLDAFAAACAVAALALVVPVAARIRRGRRRAPVVGELEEALRLARSAAGRPVADRRRALGLLARVLTGRNRELAGSASTLAWSEPVPEPGELSALVAEVDREVES